MYLHKAKMYMHRETEYTQNYHPIQLIAIGYPSPPWNDIFNFSVKQIFLNKINLWIFPSIFLVSCALISGAGSFSSIKWTTSSFLLLLLQSHFLDAYPSFFCPMPTNPDPAVYRWFTRKMVINSHVLCILKEIVDMTHENNRIFNLKKKKQNKLLAYEVNKEREWVRDVISWFMTLISIPGSYFSFPISERPL